jgi:hypothetical protein
VYARHEARYDLVLLDEAHACAPAHLDAVLSMSSPGTCKGGCAVSFSVAEPWCTSCTVLACSRRSSAADDDRRSAEARMPEQRAQAPESVQAAPEP